MKKLSPTIMRAVKVVHLVSVSVWISGIMATLVIVVALNQQNTQQGILALLSLADFVDYLLIIPGATLCYLIGTFYGVFTVWGFVKHKWIILKWVLYNAACLPAMILAQPSIEAMRQFVVANNITAASTVGFHEKVVMHGVLSSYVLITAVVIAGVSVYKPFRKKTPRN
jgi:hypothetical protein